MKIRLKKSRGSVNVRIEAESDQEGVDLKDIVVAAAKGGLTLDAALQGFEQRGYSSELTKDARQTKEFRLRRTAKGGRQ